MSLQRTLALVKPDAVDKADEIVEAAMQAGFTVLEVYLFFFYTQTTFLLSSSVRFRAAISVGLRLGDSFKPFLPTVLARHSNHCVFAALTRSR